MYHRAFNMGIAEAKVNEVAEFPECRACDKGDLLPLSDFGGQGAAVHYKAWVCSNPDCGFNLKIRNGEINLNEPILSGPDRPRRTQEAR